MNSMVRQAFRPSRSAGMDWRLWRTHAFDLIFPPQCVACHAVLSDGHAVQICSACRAEIAGDEIAACVRCGSRVATNPYASSCPSCRGEAFRFQRAIAIGNYRGRLRELIYQCKRRHQETVAFQLGRLLGRRAMVSLLRTIDFDCIVPMPSHRFRQWMRGMNPALVVAEGVARETRCELIPDLLRYQRHTAKQGTLSRTRRLENVKSSMRVNPRLDPRGLRILLVDDVMASGATANEASRALRDAGVRNIVVAVVARGTGSN